MPLTFAGTIDPVALPRAARDVMPLVATQEVAAGWERESSLPGFSVGGLARHLVSQFADAVGFLRIQPPPPHAAVVSLAELYERTDWFAATVDSDENTSIRDDFNEMAAGGHGESVGILEQAVADLPAAMAGAGETTFVPWQDCSLATDDFLVVRLMEAVVHADDLAVSVGLPTPAFDDDVLHPALALLAMLGERRHGQDAAVRALSRKERALRPASAF
jgi:hypothetical protein